MSAPKYRGHGCRCDSDGNTASVILCTTLTIVGNLFVVELHDIIQYASGHRIMTTPHQIIDMLCINHLLRK